MHLCLTLLWAVNEGLRHCEDTSQPADFCSEKKKITPKDTVLLPCSTTTSFDLNLANLLQNDFLSQLQIHHLSKCYLNQPYTGLLDSCMVWIQLWQMFLLYCMRCSFYIAWFNFSKIIHWNKSPSNLHLLPWYPPNYKNSELQVSL